MVGSKIQPHLSLQLAAGAVVRVYDQDHLTSSVLSLCSGKAPVANTVFAQKYIQCVCQTTEDVYLKVSELAHAFCSDNAHAHVWQKRLKHSRDWWRWCRQFNERSHALVWAAWTPLAASTEPRVGLREPAIREQIHRIPRRFHHASLLHPLTTHYSYSYDLFKDCRWMSVCSGYLLWDCDGLQKRMLDKAHACPC